jgi:ferredoxin-NADP reductase
MNYDARLLNRKMISTDIMSVSLDKPEHYEFQPGQFCFLNLESIGIQDERGLRRHLSIASAPHEKELLFATKISASAFKQTLLKMPLGNMITIEPPLGTFTLPGKTANPVICLAGGIGITPFRSLVHYIINAQTDHKVTLFYSNRLPGEAIFLDEFQSIADTHEHISVVPTMTRVESSSTTWSGLTGRLNPSMIKEGCKEWQDAIYFIAGPPKMSDSMKEILEEMDIHPDRIRVERFVGY